MKTQTVRRRMSEALKELEAEREFLLAGLRGREDLTAQPAARLSLRRRCGGLVELGKGSGGSENVDEVRRGAYLTDVSLSYSWREISHLCLLMP